jgi:hypothetical protein
VGKSSLEQAQEGELGRGLRRVQSRLSVGGESRTSKIPSKTVMYLICPTTGEKREGRG